jgi:hypothetical protein
MYIPLSNWTRSPRSTDEQSTRPQETALVASIVPFAACSAPHVLQHPKLSSGSGLSGSASASGRADAAADCGAAAEQRPVASSSRAAEQRITDYNGRLPRLGHLAVDSRRRPTTKRWRLLSLGTLPVTHYLNPKYLNSDPKYPNLKYPITNSDINSRNPKLF